MIPDASGMYPLALVFTLGEEPDACGRFGNCMIPEASGIAAGGRFGEGSTPEAIGSDGSGMAAGVPFAWLPNGESGAGASGVTAAALGSVPKGESG
jgi:hypothetical protein